MKAPPKMYYVPVLINVRLCCAMAALRRVDRHRGAYCLTRLGVSSLGLTNLEGSLNEKKGLHRSGRDSAGRARRLLLYLARLRRPVDERHTQSTTLRRVGASEVAASKLAHRRSARRHVDVESRPFEEGRMGTG